MSPDYSPIMGVTEVDGFLARLRLGHVRLQGGADRRRDARRARRDGKTPELIEPFALERFYTDTLVSELAAAAVTH